MTFSRRYAEDPLVRRGATPPIDEPLLRQPSRRGLQGGVSRANLHLECSVTWTMLRVQARWRRMVVPGSRMTARRLTDEGRPAITELLAPRPMRRVDGVWMGAVD